MSIHALSTAKVSNCHLKWIRVVRRLRDVTHITGVFETSFSLSKAIEDVSISSF